MGRMIVVLAFIVAAAGATPICAVADGPAIGYWRQQGQPKWTWCGSDARTFNECRDRMLGDEHREILDATPGRTTFRCTRVVGGGTNVATWSATWTAPPIVIPGQVIRIATTASVQAASNERPQWPCGFQVPGAQFIGSGPVLDLRVGSDTLPALAAGKSVSNTNASIAAPVPPSGTTPEAQIHVFTGYGVDAYIPYVWISGAPPRETPAPATPPAQISGTTVAGAAAGPGNSTRAGPSAGTASGATAGGATAGGGGAANVPPPVSKRLFFNGNDGGVSNGGRAPTFTLSAPARVTYVMTYHWNGGTGAPAGTIALVASDGTMYGPWPVTVTNRVYWEVRPDIVLPAGRYQVIDSSPSTWAQNGGSGGAGMVDIRGERQ